MASDRSQVRPSWRPAGNSPRLGASSSSGWRRIDPAASPTRARGARPSRLALGVLVALAAYAAAVWLILWLRPARPAGLYLVGAGYQDNPVVPHNTHGLNAMEVVARLGLVGKDRGWFSADDGLGRVHREEKLGPEAFERIPLGDLREPNVLVYVTAQGGADDARGAYLFLDEPDLLREPEDKLDTSGKLYLKKVVDDLAAVPSKKFCLVLDVTLAPANVPLGMVRNDFIAKLKELGPDIARARNLVVIAPTSPGHRTWSSEAWRQTIFGHYVAEALGGLRASGDNSRVDTRALFAHVSEKVKAWTWEHRRDVQAPILLPEGGSAPIIELARASVVLKAPPQEPDLAPIAKGWVDRWRSRWAEHDAIEETGPEAYAPALWREYRDALLRFEGLVRSLLPAGKGSDKVLDKVEKTLGGLARRIEEARTLGLDRSGDANLAMGAVRGDPPIDVKEAFARLLDPKKADQVEINPRNRSAFYEALLDRLQAASVPEDFAAAGGVLLRLGRGTNRQRPAEAHFLAILLRDMPRDAAGSEDYRELVGLALRVRRQAEFAAVGLGRPPARGRAGPTYAEQVAPLVEARVDAADLERRKAEDLLFADDPARWEESKKGLLRAEVAYGEAQDAAKRWRAALDARNRALSDLPYYAAWAARRAQDGPLIDLLEENWKRAHEVTSNLVPGLPDLLLPDVGPIRAKFLEECRREAPGVKPEEYDATLGLLDTPFLEDLENRLALFESLRKLDAIATPPGAAGTTPIDEEKPDAALGRSTDAARRRARLALAALGPLAAPLLKPGDAPDPVAEGARIGQLYRGHREAIADRLRDRRPIPERPGGLRRADELARLLVAGQFDRPESPTLVYRRRLLQRLLLGQARRALDDHWYSEADDPALPPDSAGSVPYFKASAESFLADLKLQPAGSPLADPKLRPLDWADDPGFLALRGELDAAPRLALKAPESPLVATDEPSLGLHYRIEAPPGASRRGRAPGQEGRPVVWLAVDGDPRVAIASPRGDGRRDVAIDDPDGSPPGRLGPGLASSRFDWRVDFSALAKAAAATAAARPVVSSGKIRLDGRYRGQVLREETRFEAHPVPEIVVAQAPPRATGDVVVRADPSLVERFGRAEGGSLVIVLDCSGSMGVPPGQPEDAPSKYREATRALETILRRVTRGTRVSLWAFGQAGFPARKAETIAQILPPTPWDPRDEGRVADLMRRIEYPALEPWNESPIVRTMLRAASDFSGASGFKSMLVLTDGLDTSFAGQVASPDRPKAEVDAVLRRAFAGSGVEINVVGYKIEKDQDAVQDQFRVIQEFRNPGTFYPVRQAEDLADALSRALRPTLRYSAQGLSNVRVRGEVELGDSPSPEGGFKELDPGGYKLVVDASGREAGRFERDMIIKPGDHLVVRMGERRRGRIDLGRVAWSEDPPLGVPNKNEGDWRLSALMSQKRGDGLALRVALERRPDERESAMEVVRPRESWMEAKAEGGEAAPFQQCWARLDAYPAPAWELTVPAWPDRPQPARPVVSAWWDPDQEAKPTAVLRRADFRSFEEARELAVPLEGGEAASIESVGLEDLPAGEAPPGIGWRGAKCLVVRARYPKGLRFWVKPLGLRTESAEHRFHTRANKYTGRFWPVTEDEARSALAGIGLVSVEEFQKRATARGFAIEGLEARFPTPGDLGPPEASTAKLQGPLP